MAKAVETRRMIEAAGMKCPLVTGGSTGTYNIDTQIDGMTEIQPGSFLFMDLDYNRIGGADGPVYRDFRNSLFVIATAISKPTDDAVIVDAGFKAFSTDRPFVPQCTTVEGLTYAWAGDEHGKVSLANASRPVNVGDRLEFVVPHCDPTVNLYDRIYGVRGDRVETEWRITARGMSQ
jgi:D-serine deaminase-like pyridoxal phosphate-dependent protein